VKIPSCHVENLKETLNLHGLFTYLNIRELPVLVFWERIRINQNQRTTSSSYFKNLKELDFHKRTDKEPAALSAVI
jgi:hypothetical protein